MRYGDGVTNQYQYDSLNRLTNLTWNLSVTTLAKFSYQLGAAGTRTNLSENLNGTSKSYQWQYDNLYRLTNEAIGITAPANLFYQYDSVGNRTNRQSTISQLPTVSYSYNTNDWLAGDQYDPNGNTTNSSGNFYQYDVMNHITNAVVSGHQIVMTYDGDGNRVSKAVGGTTTYYLVDDANPSGYSQVLEEWTVTSIATNLSKVYNYGSALISQREPGISTNYFISDGHGSTRMLMDNGGTVVYVMVYDAYGNLIASNGILHTAYLYSGQQFDSDLQLYVNRARYLNTGTGRFWTADSTDGNNEDPLSLHKYLYAQDDPVNMDDPSGHDGDLISLDVATSIGAGLDGFYNGGVVYAGQALQTTIIGVQNGETESEILGDYLNQVGTGIELGIAVSAVADIAGDLVFGREIEGEPMEVEVNGANTVQGSRDFALAGSTTEDVTAAAGRAAQAVKAKYGLNEGDPKFGTYCHTALKEDIRAMGNDLHAEVSYKGGDPNVSGKDSVRLDVVKGDPSKPEVVYDLKTGSAEPLSAARFSKFAPIYLTVIRIFQ